MTSNNDEETSATKCIKDDPESQYDKIFSIEGVCLYEGSYTLYSTENDETVNDLIDFEKIIDLTRGYEDNAECLKGIKEFEAVLSGFDTPEVDSADVKDILSLEEVKDFLKSTENESCSLNAQIHPTPHTGRSTNIKTDDVTEINLNNNDMNTKIEIQDNEIPDSIDGVSFKDIEPDIKTMSFEEDVQSISSDGYHSSDFEFITETEAKMEGQENNFNSVCSTFKSEKGISSDTSGNIEQSENNIEQMSRTKPVLSQGLIDEEDRDSDSSLTLFQIQQLQMAERFKDGNLSDPGEGPSGLNNLKLEYTEENYRENHVVPEGEGYLELFQGPYDPVLPMSDIILLENKSIRPSPMNIQYEGIGFEKQLVGRNFELDSSEEEYEDEAKDSVEKILFMYPYDNRKPRRKKF